MIREQVSHYRILQKLGGGGMGVVYEALDLKLQRRVALKFLPEHLASCSEALERFHREARAASALNHPNICTVHEIGEQDGDHFIVMELMKGQTVKHRIASRSMDLTQVARVAEQIAEALEAAHAEGIIHRDLKPENVFVTERGQAKVLDFGLAKIKSTSVVDSEQPTAAGDAHLTETGTAVGTVSYMSPEQARGQEIDARTDLFSFGILLYEMSTGVLPFPGSTPAETFSAILKDPFVPPSRINPKISPELERIINKALQKDRRLRYQSAKEMRSDLQRLLRDMSSTAAPRPAPSPKLRFGFIAAGIVSLLIVAGLWLAQREKTSPLQSPVASSIAVLPFLDLSPRKDQEYFSDGLAEELLNDLAKTPGLHVAGRTSSFAFKGKNEDLRVIASRLNVATVLEGSVRKEGNRVRITAQLVNAKDGYHLWSDSYDRELDDIFAVQEEIAQSVGEALKIKLLGGKNETPAEQPRNIEAYNAYLQGRYFLMRRTKEDLEKAIGYFQQAVQMQPDYGLAWVGLAETHIRQAGSGFTSIEKGNSLANEEVRRALTIDPNLAEAYAMRGWIKRTYELDFQGAKAAFQKALELKPWNATILIGAGQIERTLGHMDEAMKYHRRALTIDPLDITAEFYLGVTEYYAGQYDAAEEAFQRTLDLNPEFPVVHVVQGLASLMRSRPESALAMMQKEPDPTWRAYGLVLAYHALGRRKESDDALARLQHDYRGDFAFQIGEAHAFRGEPDKAFEWLERAYSVRDGGLSEIMNDPLLKSIQRDPRYELLLKKLHLI